MALEIFRLMGSVFVDTDKANKSLNNVDKKASGFGNTLLSGIGTAAKWAAGIAVAAGTAGLAISKMAIDSYAEYEQLVGGVETLFGKSSDTVLEYAKNAYKTAGMTANEYMETTTSFAASLLSSLKGDTEAAAKYADMAITDMSDNANKMGTSMEMIQNAYQGFAKQNYAMLDNLKLGYGGTKTEMQRLLKDADAINAKQGKITKYSIDNLSDVYEAIHVIQTEMGITGTTAKEATETISGQIGMLKARFENFKNTLGEALAPVVKSILSELIDNLPTIEGLVTGLATAAVKVVDFAMPYITAALDFISEWFSKVPELGGKVSEIFADLGELWREVLQPAFENAWEALKKFAEPLTSIAEYIADWVKNTTESIDVMDLLREACWFVEDALDAFSEGLMWLKDKGTEVVNYIVDSFEPTFENLKTMFEAVKDKVQPFIDKLSDYIKSGEAAKDATDLLKGAGDLLKEAFDLVAEAAAWVTDKIIEFSDWCVEHKETVETIAIIIGSFAAAWGLVNGALALWNGLATVGAAVTGALASAGSILAGVIAFLTSPITLVIAAIGAVIAIGVLLWKNWDTIKAKTADLWKDLKEKFSQIKESVVGKVTELKDKAVSKFNEIKNGISEAVNGAKQAAVDKFNEIKNSVVDKVSAIYSKVKEKFDAVKNAIKTSIESARDTVSNVIQKIKDLFNFDLKLNIKIPKVTISGGEAPWGIGGKGRLPSFNVKWAKKGYDKALMMDDPTIFGMGSSGSLLGAGDGNGNEIVVGESHLLKMIGKVVSANTATQDGLDVALLQDIRGLLEQLIEAGIYLDTGALVGGLAKPMNKRLGQLQAAKARV